MEEESRRESSPPDGTTEERRTSEDAGASPHLSGDGTDEGTPRRVFLKQAAATVAGLYFAPLLLGDGSPAFGASSPAGSQAASAAAAETISVRLRVNGSSYELRLEPRVTVLDLLRERLGLTGTKKGCNHGQCGACTVLIDGRRINSCLSLATVYDGSEVTTVEGLAQGDQLHPVQAAFIQHDGFQCGYCTPGQICSAVGMLAEVEQGAASHVTPDVRRTGRSELTDDEIRERMSGNLCRCGAYPGIVAAVRAASARR